MGKRFIGALIGLLLGYFFGETMSITYGGVQMFFDVTGALIGSLCGFYIGGLWAKKNNTD